MSKFTPMDYSVLVDATATKTRSRRIQQRNKTQDNVYNAARRRKPATCGDVLKVEQPCYVHTVASSGPARDVACCRIRRRNQS